MKSTRKTRGRQVTSTDVIYIGDAIEKLTRARLQLQGAGANHAAAYVGRALKSAQGAHRHAVGMLSREAVQS